MNIVMVILEDDVMVDDVSIFKFFDFLLGDLFIVVVIIIFNVVDVLIVF